MGIFRKISSKLKPIEDVIEDLKHAGLAKEEVEIFQDIYEINEKDIKDVNKLNKKLDKPLEKVDKANRKIEHIEKRMEKIKGKVRISSYYKIIKICHME